MKITLITNRESPVTEFFRYAREYNNGHIIYELLRPKNIFNKNIKYIDSDLVIINFDYQVNNLYNTIKHNLNHAMKVLSLGMIDLNKDNNSVQIFDIIERLKLTSTIAFYQVDEINLSTYYPVNTFIHNGKINNLEELINLAKIKSYSHINDHNV
jgi:hypothetical protein